MPDQERPQLAHIPDLLTTVPYLLGFHPGDSGVIVGIRDERLHLVSRFALPGTIDQETAQAVPAHETAAVLHDLAVECAALDVTDLVVLGYGEEPPVLALFDTATAVFTVRGLNIMHLLRVTGACYIEHDRHQPGRTDDPTPFDPDTRPALPLPNTQHRPAADRATLAAMVAPLDGSAAAAMAAAIQAATDVLDAVTGLVPPRAAAPAAAGTADEARRVYGESAVDKAISVTRRGGTIDDAQAAELIVLLRDTKVRDYAATRSDADQPRDLQLWLGLTRRAAPTFAAAPASLAAYAAWRTHQPMLARFAVERALQDDPDYSLAGLLDLVLTVGLPPEAVGDLAAHHGAADTDR
jgi:hypothetical protein